MQKILSNNINIESNQFMMNRNSSNSNMRSKHLLLQPLLKNRDQSVFEDRKQTPSE